MSGKVRMTGKVWLGQVSSGYDSLSQVFSGFVRLLHFRSG